MKRLQLWKRALAKKNKEEFNVYVIGLRPEFATTKAADPLRF